LKLVGIKEFYNITRAKIISALSCAVGITVCATATFIVDISLDSTIVHAKPVETAAQTSEEVVVVVVSAGTDESTEPAESTSGSTSASGETSASSSTSSTSTESESSATSETTETSATSSSAETEETSAATQETAAETTKAITEKELYLVVYATTTINVRSGPGTEYDVVKNVFAGDQIDVCAITSNDWYKTYNGNYVKASFTTQTKPTNTPTPKPTPKPAATTTTAEETEEQNYEPSGSGNSCLITFYGPQPLGDGTYSTSTATGTTCTEGRTCAADWSIYPAGTVIYIENDPLGGDGYYTVEDRGPGVKGYHIDLYADDGESGSYSTCRRTVYEQ